MRDKLTSENQRRLEILVGFGKINGQSVSGNLLMNIAVESFFLQKYEEYKKSADPKDFILEMMEKVLPSGYEEGTVEQTAE